MFPGMQWVVLSTDVEFCEVVRRILGNVEVDVGGVRADQGGGGVKTFVPPIQVSRKGS